MAGAVQNKLEILRQLLTEGFSKKDIAKKIGISVSSVCNYSSKLGFSDPKKQAASIEAHKNLKLKMVTPLAGEIKIET